MTIEELIADLPKLSAEESKVARRDLVSRVFEESLHRLPAPGSTAADFAAQVAEGPVASLATSIWDANTAALHAETMRALSVPAWEGEQMPELAFQSSRAAELEARVEDLEEQRAEDAERIAELERRDRLRSAAALDVPHVLE